MLIVYLKYTSNVYPISNTVTCVHILKKLLAMFAGFQEPFD